MRRLTLLLGSTLLLLTGCGSGTATQPGASGLPTVSGTYGAQPTLAFADSEPPTQRRVEVLHEGAGEPVARGDLVVVDYLGQFWDGEVFDESFSREQPNGFSVTDKSFFPGFSESIVGVRTGSRVLMVMPPPEGAMEGSGTLVFVIDVVQAYDGDAGAKGAAVRGPSTETAITVTGKPGTRPDIKLPEELPPPERNSTVVLAEGNGEPVRDGLVVVQYTIVDWTGKVVQSTWEDGTPTSAVVGDEKQAGLLTSLEGVPVGSRVLVQLPPPKDAGAEAGAVAAVVDIIDQPTRNG